MRQHAGPAAWSRRVPGADERPRPGARAGRTPRRGAWRRYARPARPCGSRAGFPVLPDSAVLQGARGVTTCFASRPPSATLGPPRASEGVRVTCPACGHQNPAGLKFCEECGNRLAATCPSCGAPLSATAKFCGECGARLPARSAAGSRRRRGECGAPSAIPAAPPTRHRPPAATRRPPSGASSASCSPTSSASRRSPRTATRRRSASSWRATSSWPRGHRALRRHGREVHRRRGHGGLGRADRPRGRRRAGGPRRPRAGRRGPHGRWRPTRRSRRGRRPDRRGGRHLGATNQGMVAGDLVNTAVPAPVGRAARDRARRRGDACAPRSSAIAFEPAGEQLAQGQAAPGPGLAGAARRRRARRRAAGARGSRRRSSVATRSCACSRTCSTPPAGSAGRGSCRSSARPASARAGSPGSS